MAEPTEWYVCPYCGTNGYAITLERVEGGPFTTTPVSDRYDEHAIDCPVYRPTVQPYRVPGPLLVPGLTSNR